MRLHVEFDSGHVRDIPVSNRATVTVDDPGSEVLALQGLTCMYLTSDRGETLIGDGASAEAIARSIDWVPLDEIAAVRDRLGHAEYLLGQRDETIRELQAHLNRQAPVVTVQAGAGEEAREAARRAETVMAERLNDLEDGVDGPESVWAHDEEPGPVAA